MTAESNGPGPAAGDAPTQQLRGYVICAEQRSGSSYLCQLLWSTGLLGRPADYFNSVGRRRNQPDYPEDAEAQLGEILRQGRTENGVYGFKIFAFNFDRVAAARWAGRLPRLSFIHLNRRDLLGQAISSVRALQTGQYSANFEAGGTPSYDAGHILAELHRFARSEARWAAYFARCGIDPLRLCYEDIEAEPQAGVDKVAALLGLEERPLADLSRVALRVQRDSLSREWRARFIAEMGDVSRLDDVGEPSRLKRLTARLQRAVSDRA